MYILQTGLKAHASDQIKPRLVSIVAFFNDKSLIQIWSKQK